MHLIRKELDCLCCFKHCAKLDIILIHLCGPKGPGSGNRQLREQGVQWGLRCESAGEECTDSAGDLGSIPGLGRSPEEGNGNPLQYSCLDNSMDRGDWWDTVYGVAKSDMTEQQAMNTQWTDFHLSWHTLCSIPIIKKQGCSSLGLTNLIPKIRNIHFRVGERKIHHLSLKSSLHP